MVHEPLCSCGSAKYYCDCCQIIHRGNQANNALTLMRARYSAHVLGLYDFIVASTLPSQQPLLEVAALAEWNSSIKWQQLTVHSHVHLGALHTLVSFVADFEQQGKVQQHAEKSLFVFNQQWYFVHPALAKVAVNAPCICDSGIKYKKCCGQFMQH